LQILWQRGEAGSREIAGEIYEEVTDSKVASVQKLSNGWKPKAASNETGANGTPIPRAVSQEEYLRSRLQALADRL